ncbi:Uncharacterized conserved protein [Shigella dysenteriae]|uniref:Uncharacterized conserved protein n=1 Tax=Shigella dysenteriae TaxID=622 RepID=A0A2X2HHI4_SHIDY|nr:Uncharacterized conserved protein [Shigella dysenteriae]
MWYQKTLTLSAKSRGFHLVTDEILNQLADMPRVNRLTASVAATYLRLSDT